jgi:hypothetical protein
LWCCLFDGNGDAVIAEDQIHRAEAIELSIPPAFILRADEVLE